MSLRNITLMLTVACIFSGCPETPSQTDPDAQPPEEPAATQDAGGETPPQPGLTDSGNEPPPQPSPADAGDVNPIVDAGTTAPSISDSGTIIALPQDSGQGPSIVDAGQISTPLLEGDAGLLQIPTLSVDGGLFTPEAFLYIRNISLPPSGNGFIEVMINSDVEMGGLQFMLTGITPIAGSTTGGLVETTNGFTGTLTASGQFLAFTMTNDTLPPHNGPLVEIPISAVTSTQICITDVIISDTNGDSQILSYAECKPAP